MERPVALVTGANRGLGKEVCRQLVEHGYYVLLGSRSLALGEATARELGANVQAVELDVTSSRHQEQLRELVEHRVASMCW